MGINVNVELWGLSYLFMVVTVGITAGVVSKNKLAIPEESGPGDKTDSWGFEGPEQVVIYAFFFSQSALCFHTYAEPILWHIRSHMPRPNLQHLLCNILFSFKQPEEII